MRRAVAIFLLATACGAPPAPGGGGAPGPTGTPAFDESWWVVEPTYTAPSCCHRWIEAEDLSSDWRRQTNLVPYSGTGFLTSGLSMRPATGTASVAVDLEPGTYAVWVRAFADDKDRAFVVELGGVAFAPTHGPSSARGFTWVKAGEVELDGPTRLVVRDGGDGIEVVDALFVTNGLGADLTLEEARARLFDPDVADSMMHDELIERTERRRTHIPVPLEIEQWDNRRAFVEPRLAAALGLFPEPERTPLDAEVVRTIPRDEYDIDVVRFESRPGVVVTANLYIPTIGQPPFPVVLSPLGHGLSKRSHFATSRAARLAELGFASLVYDPFGQGERKVSGNEHHRHWGLTITGLSNLAITVWDSVRAIDYLETRSEIDATRLAVSGYSGGGLNTLFLAAYDERVAVAAPASYVTTYEAFLSTGEYHDPCSYAPGVAGFTDMGELVALAAPRPYLVLSGERDRGFPIRGALDSVALADIRYGLEDATLEHAPFDVGHTYDRPMRERMYGFVDAALRGGPGDPIDEGTLDLLGEDDERLWVSPSGRVATSRPLSRLARERAEDHIDRLPAFEDLDRERYRELIFEHLDAPRDATPEAELVDAYTTVFGFDVERYVFETTPGVRIPAALYVHDGDSPVVVVTDASGTSLSGVLDAARRAGVSALYVQTRGRGEIAAPETWLMASNALHGDTLAVHRAFDLAQIRDAMRSLPSVGNRPVALIARGPEASVEGLFAQVLYDVFDAAVIGPTFGSWRDILTRTPPSSAYVFDILGVADVPQLVDLAAERPLWIALDSTGWRSLHPTWVEPLEQRVRLDAAPSLEEALAWASETIAAR
ncbi:MAG: alpha/beta hydrolase [Deltaproteobacteria bacterium]